MKEYNRSSIQDIVSEVNRTVFLPDIQRPYVWNEGQIYKLFDSLMRGYPISTMLFWQLTKENLEKIESRDSTKIKIYQFIGDNESENAEHLNRERDNYSLVLDGQQRLTSIYLALKGAWISNFRRKKYTKELYVNAFSGKNENEDGILYEFEFKDRNIGLVSVDKTDDGEGVEKVWVNVKRVYESEIGRTAKRKEFVNQIIAQSKIDSKYLDTIDDLIDELDKVLKQERVINYYPETEIDYERVLDIFVRTNSGGTKLGYSDLLFSKIKLNWGEAREKFDQLTEKISVYNYDFDNDFLLKCCLVLYASKMEDVKYKPSNLGLTFINKMKTDWDEKIVKSLSLVIDILGKFHIRDKRLLPSYNALIPVFFWIASRNRTSYKLDNEQEFEELNKIRSWLIKALLSGLFGGQSDTVLYKCKEALDKTKLDTFPTDEIKMGIESIKNRRMSVEGDYIDKIKYRSKESYLLLSLCYGNNINFAPLYDGNFPEQDHIFSKHELRTAGVDERLINSIYNIRLVSQIDNRTKSNVPFREWERLLGNNRELVFKTHLIPTDKVWTVDNYQEFIAARKAEILKII